MKISLKLFFFVLIVVSWGCNQTSDSNRLKMYKESFDYIRNDNQALEFLKKQAGDSVDCIMISKQVVFLEMTSFYDHFAKSRGPINNKSGYQLLDSLRSIDKKRVFNPYKDEKLKGLTDCDQSNAVLFFSRPFKRQLIAELFYNQKEGRSLSYSNISRFNKSLMFLFSFNDSDTIEKVITTNVIYD